MEWLAIVEHDQAPLILSLAGLVTVWGMLRKHLGERIRALVDALEKCERMHSASRADNRKLARAVLMLAQGDSRRAQVEAAEVWERQLGDAHQAGDTQ